MKEFTVGFSYETKTRELKTINLSKDGQYISITWDDYLSLVGSVNTHLKHVREERNVIYVQPNPGAINKL
jgi:hypothetical protein